MQSFAQPDTQNKSDKPFVMDFKHPKAASFWTTVNDNVMGGRSIGDFQIKDNILVFEGKTNTNGGGFSSIRSKPISQKIPIAESFMIRCKGDGRAYRLTARTQARFQNIQVGYYASFETVKDQWMEVEIPLELFQASIRGMDVSKIAPPLRTEDIESVGLMIYDKKDGPFHLEVEWIRPK